MNNLSLPHTGEMVLIDEIIDHGAYFVEVRAKISPQNAFLEDERFPTYKSIEMMAQSLGAYKGIYGSDGFNMGFLVGVRDFEIFITSLNIGDELRIRSEVSMQDAHGFGVWSSELFVNDELAARANLSVLSPSTEMFSEIKNG